MAKSKNYLIGIDEVGRGPLAGPVTVAAVLLTANLKTYKLKNLKTPLRDSKKLNPKQRKIWFYFIKKQKIPYAVANVFPKTIDKINISKAANLAATKVLGKLITNNRQLTTDNLKILLDGGLKVNPNPKTKKFKNLKTIIKGDEKIPAISLASIIAKVRRDKYMEKMHKKFPQYNFKRHKGYGTEIHYKLLKKNGASKIHRKSFLSSLKSK
ncbi:MAG: ribonuclease HII [Patescibacteria group bacterium]